MLTTAFEATLQSGRLLSEAANINTRDIHAMAAVFDMLITLAIIMPGTSTSYFAQWHTLVTFAWSLDTLTDLLQL